jgi:hypothetical protein
MEELFFRFLIGGTLVSAFAVSILRQSRRLYGC